ncbi:MAG: hypothetical protein V8S72_00745 [Oscillospiraceae bacterium]
MTNKMFDSFGAVKNALEKAKDTAVGKATEALDANNDGTVDIQDIIILAIKLPGVHVTRKLLTQGAFQELSSGSHR